MTTKRAVLSAFLVALAFALFGCMMGDPVPVAEFSSLSLGSAVGSRTAEDPDGAGYVAPELGWR